MKNLEFNIDYDAYRTQDKDGVQFGVLDGEYKGLSFYVDKIKTLPIKKKDTSLSLDYEFTVLKPWNNASIDDNRIKLNADIQDYMNSIVLDFLKVYKDNITWKDY